MTTTSRVRKAPHQCNLPTPTSSNVGEIRRCEECNRYWIVGLDYREPLGGRWCRLTWLGRKLRRIR